MAVFNAAFPIPSGKVDAPRAFARETLGARHAEFEEYQQRRGVTRDLVDPGDTRRAAFSVVWIESPDAEKAIAEGVRDPSEFGAWFRERVKDVNGIELDPAGPLPPATEVTLDWSE